MQAIARAAFVAFVMLCGASARAEVIVAQDGQGRVVYQRTRDDVAFVGNSHIGLVPRGMDPHLWYAYDSYIMNFCTQEGVDPVMAKAIIWAESRFQWRATSKSKARGLMQVIDSTAKRMGHPRPGSYDPIENIRAGVKYIAFLQRKFNGNLIKVAAGYNAGEGAVERHGGVPPYPETVGYVTRVLDRWSRMTRGIA